jgi:hypothetical protein
LFGLATACGTEPSGFDVPLPVEDTGLDAAGDTTRTSDTTPLPEVPRDTGMPPDVATDGDGDLLASGEPCPDDDACASALCVRLAPGADAGVCSDLCGRTEDCPEGADCLLVSNSGRDATQLCIPRDYCWDPDGDGFGAGPGCQGRDCDQTRADVHVGAPEVCDGVDNNCDGTIDGNPVDAGGACDTGFLGACAAGVQVCQEGLLACVGLQAPAPETCDGVDNSCDGAVDEDATDAPAWYRDADGDRFGNPDDAVAQCSRPEGYVADPGDCDDARVDINPTVPEVCDGVDNNCDGTVDEDTARDALLWYRDADGDGFGDAETIRRACAPPDGWVAVAGDCDDTRADVYPGAPEVCDGVDNACNGVVDAGEGLSDAPLWYRDADGDGFGDAADALAACSRPEGRVADRMDCNDTDDQVFPGAPERCNGRDNNCDGTIDAGGDATDAPLWYADGDGDGFGDPSRPTRACQPPENHVGNARDCNDLDATVNPSATEVCDGIDNNCDGQVDPPTSADARVWYQDADRDTWGNPEVRQTACAPGSGWVLRPGDCNDASAAVNPDAVEVCDGLDNDCDGQVDPPASTNARTWYRDADGDTWGNPDETRRQCSQPDGFVGRAGDCNDRNDQINPDALEICDGVDNTCDGRVDPPGSFGERRWYRDSDADGYGNPAQSQLACIQPPGWVANALDCNDARGDINPDAVEVCDNVDNNCNGDVDENLSRRCYGGLEGTADVGSCRSGSQACNGGTWGACAGEVRPQAELCDGLDNDCDGTVDNIPVVVDTYTFSPQLASAHDMCDGVGERHGSQCNAAMHRTCSARACFSTGFGAVENFQNNATVACVPGGMAIVREVPWPQIQAQLGACDGTTSFFGPACSAAIHRWCEAQGLTTGWGPVERDNTRAFVSCAPRATIVVTDYPRLSTWQPTCDGITERFGLACNSAIHRECVARGFSTGWGPVENDGATAVISCLPMR